MIEGSWARKITTSSLAVKVSTGSFEASSGANHCTSIAPTSQGGRTKSLKKYCAWKIQHKRGKLTTEGSPTPGFISSLSLASRAKFKDLQFNWCILIGATRVLKDQMKLQYYKSHCMIWRNELLTQLALPNTGQDDRCLDVVHWTLCLAGVSTTLCQCIKSGAIQSCLLEVAEVSIDLKQLSTLTSNHGIKP